MAGNEDEPTGFRTTTEESMRQAEAAFGGSGRTARISVPGAAPAQPPAQTQIQAAGIPGSDDDARLRRVRRVLIAVIALAGVVGVAVLAVILVASSGDSSSSGTSTSVSQPSGPSGPGRPSRPTSNFSASGLTGSRATARRLAGPGAGILLARVAPDQLQVIARDGSRQRIVVVSPRLTRRIDTPAGPATGREFGFEHFRAAVPARLVRAIDRRFGVPASRIDYMVLTEDPIDRHVQWLVYPSGAAGHFQADEAGGSLTRVG